MRPPLVVEPEVFSQIVAGLKPVGAGLHSRSTNMLSWYLPLPSMLIFRKLRTDG